MKQTLAYLVQMFWTAVAIALLEIIMLKIQL